MPSKGTHMLLFIAQFGFTLLVASVMPEDGYGSHAFIGSIVGAIITANASKKAAKAQEKGAELASETQLEAQERALEAVREMFDISREDLAPYRETGELALQDLDRLVRSGEFATEPAFAFTTADFEADPGYEFRLAEGLKAIDRAGSARGLALSGRQLKDLQRYGQGLASDEFGRAYGRAFNEYITGREGRNLRFNRLASLAGLGQTSSTTSANLATQAGAQQAGIISSTGARLSDLQLQAANARASGYIGPASAYAQALYNVDQSALQLVSIYGTGGFGGGGGGGQAAPRAYQGSYQGFY